MTRVLKPCGTKAAYNRHLRWGEEPCEPCVEANRAYNRAHHRAEEAQGESMPWTDAEIGFLQDHLDWKSPRIAEELGRSPGAVRQAKRKLRDGSLGAGRTFWSEDEIDFVRRTPNLTTEQVAHHLGRPFGGVAGIRKRLAKDEGVDFGNNQKSPHNIGPRRLLAKTCIGCGLLLEASWFNSSNDKSRGRKWKTQCARCLYKSDQAAHPDRPSKSKRDGGKSARAARERLQTITRERATRHREPWLEADHEVLRDASLTTFEKALSLGRTYLATHSAVSNNGYTSRVGKGDPMKGVWVIDNPNTEVAA